jgi:prephenate dehydratase
LQTRPQSAAILAIENSQAGAVQQHLDLIYQGRYSIVEMYIYDIRLHLAGLAHQSLEQVHTILSHPMAFKQCTQFLAQHRYQSKEISSTSAALEWVMAEANMGYAAIAGLPSISEKGAHVLQADIHDNQQNQTRFVLIHPAGFSFVHTTEENGIASMYVTASAIPILMHTMQVLESDIICTLELANMVYWEVYMSGRLLQQWRAALSDTGGILSGWCATPKQYNAI